MILRELARAEAHGVEPVEADQRRRRVDRVHHVVERPRQGVDVLAVEGRDERAVQPLDDFVRQEVALVLDFLDFVGLVPDGTLGREHLLEQPGAVLQLVGERLEIAVELFFPGNQVEPGHSGRRLSAAYKPQDCSRSVYTAVTRPLHAAPGAVYHLIARGCEQRSPRAHSRRRPGHAPVSAHAASLEAGRADRRQIPAHRHPDQQLPARGHPAHLRPDAVQFGVAQPAHLADLPDGSLQPGVRRDPGGRADARQPATGFRARPTPCGRRRATSRATTPTTT